MKTPIVWMTVLGLTGAVMLTGSPLPAAEVDETVDFKEDSKLELQDWNYRAHLYLWGLGMDGQVGTGDITVPVDVDFEDILENLNGALLLGGEAHRGRWGLVIDGMFMRLGTEEPVQVPFFSMADIELNVNIVDMQLAYRVLESERYWLELLAGARYTYMQQKLDLTADPEGIAAFSASVVDEVQRQIQRSVSRAVEDAAPGIGSGISGEGANIPDAARQGIQDVRSPNPAGTTDAVVRQTPAPRLGSPGITRAERNFQQAVQNAISSIAAKELDRNLAAAQGNPGFIVDRIKDAARGRLDEIKRQASANARRALDRAEKQLTEELTQAAEEVAADTKEASKDWVDPVVGLRGYLMLHKHLALSARCDVGGFGVSSDLVWQALALALVPFNDTVALEIGYRYMDYDYHRDGFLFDMQLSGAVIGVGFTF